MKKLVKKDIKDILEQIVYSMDEAKDYLVELDGAMGDGDLGITMSTGFRTVYKEIDNLDIADVGMLLMKLGMCMNSTVPSTMGTLVSTCILRAGKTVKGKIEITLEDMVKMGKSAVEGVMERGKAKVGDKTMLDALKPAVEALDKAFTEGKSMKEAVQASYEAASEGVEKTKEMKSVFGRAAYYGEKSIGRPDSGATAVKFIFRGINEYFQKQ